MTERESTLPTPTNWADEIDDLNRDAMRSYLDTMSSVRARRPVVNAEVADDPLSGGRSDKSGPAAGGVPQ